MPTAKVSANLDDVAKLGGKQALKGCAQITRILSTAYRNHFCDVRNVRCAPVFLFT